MKIPLQTAGHLSLQRISLLQSRKIYFNIHKQQLQGMLRRIFTYIMRLFYKLCTNQGKFTLFSLKILFRRSLCSASADNNGIFDLRHAVYIPEGYLIGKIHYAAVFVPGNIRGIMLAEVNEIAVLIKSVFCHKAGDCTSQGFAEPFGVICVNIAYVPFSVGFFLGGSNVVLQVEEKLTR